MFLFFLGFHQLCLSNSWYKFSASVYWSDWENYSLNQLHFLLLLCRVAAKYSLLNDSQKISHTQLQLSLSATATATNSDSQLEVIVVFFLAKKKHVNVEVFCNVIENSRTCLLRGVIIFYVGVRKYREETADNKNLSDIIILLANYSFCLSAQK